MNENEKKRTVCDAEGMLESKRMLRGEDRPTMEWCWLGFRLAPEGMEQRT